MISFRRTFTLTALLATGLLGCGVEAPLEPTSDLARATQCGPTWDLQHVESYDGTLGVSKAFVARAERHVGQLLTAAGVCTGTLISDDLFITAGHCAVAIGDRVRFDYQNLPNGTPRAYKEVTVAAVLEQEYNASFDYAIARLSDSPGREYGHANLAPTDPPLGSLVTMIQHPFGQPKQVHSGPVIAKLPFQGPNWFNYQLDDAGGSSGSGMLNTDGQLIGIHTNGGCTSTSPAGLGNSAMRMSQLVLRSPTLAALSRSKLVWQHTDSRISIWTMEPNGQRRGFAVEHGNNAGWTPLSYQNNRILWRHTSGQISIATYDDAGNHVRSAFHGPFAGWTAINYANNRVLWKDTSGQASLWAVDDMGNYITSKAYGPFGGWTPIQFANNRLFWTQADGRVSFWVMDENLSSTSYVEHGPYPGWTAVSYSNGELFWKHTSGQGSQWSVDRNGAYLTSTGVGPHAGWDPVSSADGHLLWRTAAGNVSYWTVNADGNHMSYAEHGPFGGWTPIITAGGRP